jgi:hypothetical protein
LQSSIFRSGLSEDGYIRIRISPQGEKLLVSRASLSVRIRRYGVACLARSRACSDVRFRFARKIDACLEGISAAMAQTCQGADWKRADEARVFDDLPKLASGLLAPLRERGACSRRTHQPGRGG